MAFNPTPIPPLPADARKNPDKLVDYLESLIRTLQTNLTALQQALKNVK
jgi:hypothetical protein